MFLCFFCCFFFFFFLCLFFFFLFFFFFSSRRRHTRWTGDWSSDVCSSDLWLLRVVDAHGNEISRAPVAQMWRQVVAEGAVAVWALAEVMAVDPHLAVPVDAVELDRRQPATIRRRNREGFAVPANAAWQRTATCAGGVSLAELGLDAPVVRQIQRAPSRV